MVEGTYPVPLRFRRRMNRAIRWPLTTWRYWRAGLSLSVAIRLTWWMVWYPGAER